MTYRDLPIVVYRTKVSLFSIMASTANFSQYCAVMMAMVGCFELAIVGICFTMVTWWESCCDCCRVKAPWSMALTSWRDWRAARHWATSSSSQPLSLKFNGNASQQHERHSTIETYLATSLIVMGLGYDDSIISSTFSIVSTTMLPREFSSDDTTK